MNATWLPGYVDNGTPIQSVYDSFAKAITSATTSVAQETITLYYYSASVAGWRKIAPLLKTWRGNKATRKVKAYIGTDHGLTDPAALLEMQAAGVELLLLSSYEGIYHPKVIVWRHATGGSAWIGSHNLSLAALEKNVEFGACLPYTIAPLPLDNWCTFIEGASEPASDALLKSYQNEREAFARKQAASPKFVWSKRKKPKAQLAPAPPAAKSGSLVMEITNRETGAGGKQIQPPIASVAPFFGLSAAQGSKMISAKLKGSPVAHDLTLTRMANSTARLHIAELDYIHRPCFMIFEKVGTGFEYEIATQQDAPARYQQLDSLKLQQTRAGSRRWNII